MEKLEGAERARVFKVIGKYVTKGNREMIRLYNGTVIPSAKGVSVNDSVSLKEGRVQEVLKLQKGARCLVIKGVHAAESGVISEIKGGTALRRATVAMEGDKGKTETLLDNVMVVGAK
jgi:small subunit ribosomal protein S4e